MTNDKIWFVTGASSGFGRTMTEHLLNIGNKVIATLRKPDALSDLVARYPVGQLLVLKVDVTNKDDIIAAFARAQEVFGRIDVVFNNAGVSTNAEVEFTGDKDARDLFEVNFWGAVNVTREAVRFFREVNQPRGGLLLQNSSLLGLTGVPTTGFYSASKFALEGLTESLMAELDPAWNIKVIIIEPGPFRTDMISKNYKTLPQHPVYADQTLPGSKFLKLVNPTDLFNGNVSEAVTVIEKLSRLEDPPMRFPLHSLTVAALRAKGKSFFRLADAYESWNHDKLYFVECSITASEFFQQFTKLG